MTIYLCPRTNQWSGEDCSCPGSKDDEEHTAIVVTPADVAKFVNTMGEAYDRLNDGEDVLQDIAAAYMEMTGCLL